MKLRPRPYKLPRTDNTTLSFWEDEPPSICHPHTDALAAALPISNHRVRRILVDGGSFADILYLSTLHKMGVDLKDLKPIKTPVIGFNGGNIESEGNIVLPTNFGEGMRSRTILIEYLVMDCPSANNGIIGHSTIHNLKAVPSTYHQIMKFPIDDGIGILHDDQKESRSCYTSIVNRPVHCLDIPSTSKKIRGEATEILEEVQVGLSPDQIVKIRSSLARDIKARLVAFLHEHRNTFAWTHADMPGIDSSISSHRLNADPTVKAVKQKK